MPVGDRAFTLTDESGDPAEGTVSGGVLRFSCETGETYRIVFGK